MPVISGNKFVVVGRCEPARFHTLRSNCWRQAPATSTLMDNLALGLDQQTIEGPLKGRSLHLSLRGEQSHGLKRSSTDPAFAGGKPASSTSAGFLNPRRSPANPWIGGSTWNVRGTQNVLRGMPLPVGAEGDLQLPPSGVVYGAQVGRGTHRTRAPPLRWDGPAPTPALILYLPLPRSW